MNLYITITNITKDDYILKFPEQIQKRIIDKYSGCGRGWLQIIIDLDKKLSAINADYQVRRVKYVEKKEN